MPYSIFSSFFLFYCFPNILKTFVVNESINIIPVGEPFIQFTLMFRNASLQIIRYPNVQNTIRFICKYVNIIIHCKYGVKSIQMPDFSGMTFSKKQSANPGQLLPSQHIDDAPAANTGCYPGFAVMLIRYFTDDCRFFSKFIFL